MEELKFNPTPAQIKKMLKMKPVQLKAEQIGSGMKVHSGMPVRHKKALHQAMKKRKGVRIAFTPDELIEGSGFLDWLKSLGNMVTLPFKKLAPVLKPVAKAIAPIVAPIIASKTGIPITGDLLEKGVDVVGNLAGVGVHGKRKYTRGGASGQVVKLQDNFSTLLNSQHPIYKTAEKYQQPHDLSAVLSQKAISGKGVLYSMNPRDYLDQSTPLSIPPTFTSGGSFRTAGGSFKPAGKGGRVRYTK